jgi:serine/threonine protein phosphatase PrpC
MTAPENNLPSSPLDTSSGALDKPVQAKPNAAIWLTLDPVEPWCPTNLKEILNFEIDYRNELHEHEKTIGPWMLTVATKRGRMHAHEGSHREDAYAWKSHDLFAIYSVCDGAGSADLSRIGSEFTVREICRLVTEALLANQDKIQSCSADSLHSNLKSVLHYAVGQTARQLAELALKSELEAKEFCCTVLTALHYVHPSGGFYVFGNVGDGFIALKRRDKVAERIGASDSGAFSGEVLCFMPDPQVSEYYKNSLDRMEMFRDDEIEAVLLCTDGIEDPFFPVYKNIDALYKQLEFGFDAELCGVNYPTSARPSSVFNSTKPDEELIKWLNFEKRGENDDRTIMILHNRVSVKPAQDSNLSRVNNIKLATTGVITETYRLKRIAMFIALIMLAVFLGYVLGRFTSLAPVVGISKVWSVVDGSRLSFTAAYLGSPTGSGLVV